MIRNNESMFGIFMAITKTGTYSNTKIQENNSNIPLGQTYASTSGLNRI